MPARMTVIAVGRAFASSPEAVLFARYAARFNRRLTIALVPGAWLLAAEMLVLGRAARAETLRHGVLCERLDDLLSLPLDIAVEATGDAEAAVRHSLAAIAAGIGIAMVSKEAECVVGPALAARARAAGLPWTLVDGDQPSLLVGLVSWARTLGLPIVAAGKSSEYDFVFDPARGVTTWLSESVASPTLSTAWSLAEGDVAPTMAARAEALASLPLRTVPDSCEMALVANATGLMPEMERFHAPLARTVELPDIYGPRAPGGPLGRAGALDVFNCLRRPDEASFAGGVFVVVSLADAATGALFAGKGIPVSRDLRARSSTTLPTCSASRRRSR
jgi:predicted homoserine dehydrogenase-like protein